MLGSSGRVGIGQPAGPGGVVPPSGGNVSQLTADVYAVDYGASGVPPFIDNTPKVQAAIAAAGALAALSGAIFGRVIFPQGSFGFLGQLVCKASGKVVLLQGAGKGATVANFNAVTAGTYQIDFVGPVAERTALISDMTVLGPGTDAVNRLGQPVLTGTGGAGNPVLATNIRLPRGGMAENVYSAQGYASFEADGDHVKMVNCQGNGSRFGLRLTSTDGSRGNHVRIGCDFTENTTASVVWASNKDSAVLADSPVGFWKGNDLSGTSAVDSGSGSHPGTYTAPVTLNQYQTPIGSDATVLFGANGHLNCPAAFGPNGTLEGWGIVPALGVHRRFVEANDGGGGTSQTIDVLADGTVQGSIYDGGTPTVSSAPGLVSAGQIVHLALTWASGGNLKLYVNGALIGSTAIGVPYAPLSVAIFGDSSGGAGSLNWPSNAGGFAFYTTELSAGRIAAHYSSGTDSEGDYIAQEHIGFGPFGYYSENPADDQAWLLTSTFVQLNAESIGNAIFYSQANGRIDANQFIGGGASGVQDAGFTWAAAPHDYACFNHCVVNNHDFTNGAGDMLFVQGTAGSNHCPEGFTDNRITCNFGGYASGHLFSPTTAIAEGAGNANVIRASDGSTGRLERVNGSVAANALLQYDPAVANTVSTWDHTASTQPAGVAMMPETTGNVIYMATGGDVKVNSSTSFSANGQAIRASTTADGQVETFAGGAGQIGNARAGFTGPPVAVRARLLMA